MKIKIGPFNYLVFHYEIRHWELCNLVSRDCDLREGYIFDTPLQAIKYYVNPFTYNSFKIKYVV